MDNERIVPTGLDELLVVQKDFLRKVVCIQKDFESFDKFYNCFTLGDNSVAEYYKRLLKTSCRKYGFDSARAPIEFFVSSEQFGTEDKIGYNVLLCWVPIKFLHSEYGLHGFAICFYDRPEPPRVFICEKGLLNDKESDTCISEMETLANTTKEGNRYFETQVTKVLSMNDCALAEEASVFFNDVISIVCSNDAEAQKLIQNKCHVTMVS